MTPELKQLVNDIKRRPISALASCRTKLKRSGTQRFTGRCPLHTEKTPSFHVNDGKGTFKCFGCQQSGDAIAFLMKIDNIGFMQAVEDAAAFFGLAPDRNGIRRREYKPLEPAETPDEEKARKAAEVERARRIWLEGVSAAGSIVERYLSERRINIGTLPGGEIPASLRCHRSLEYWYQSSLPGGGRSKPKLLGRFPAMIAPLQDAAGDMQGVHITYLDPSEAGKLAARHPDDETIGLPAKKMLGTAWACSIRLGPLQDFMSCSEGIENGLSAMSCGAPPCLVAGSLGNIAGRGIGEGLPHPRRLDKRLPPAYPDMNSEDFVPPPPVKKILLIRDNDSKDQESADELFERGMRRWRARHIETLEFVPDKGLDMNDMLQRGLLGYQRFGGAA